MFKVNNKDTRPSRCLYSSVSIVNFEQAIAYWGTLNMFHTFFLCFYWNIFHTIFRCFYCWLWLSKCGWVPPYLFINVETTPAQNFSRESRESFTSTYFVKHFERLLLDQHKVTTENYYPLNFSIFWIANHGKCLAYEFGIRTPGKIAWKANSWKEKMWNFTKNYFVPRNFSETSRQTVMFRTHILSCVSNNKYRHTDMKTIYRGEPKDRNIETE